VQTASTNKPSSGTRSYDSKNVVDFLGNDFMTVALGTTWSQPTTYFAVASYDVNGAGDVVLSGDALGNLNQMYLVSNTFSIYAGSTLTGPAEDTNPHVFTAKFDSTSSAISIDGNTETTGDAGTEGVTDFHVGGRTASNAMDGFIGEIIATNATLSTSDKEKAQGYLAWKWGLEGNLPIGHPYKSAAP
jgi:hypothetical protein